MGQFKGSKKKKHSSSRGGINRGDIKPNNRNRNPFSIHLGLDHGLPFIHHVHSSLLRFSGVVAMGNDLRFLMVSKVFLVGPHSTVIPLLLSWLRDIISNPLTCLQCSTLCNFNLRTITGIWIPVQRPIS